MKWDDGLAHGFILPPKLADGTELGGNHICTGASTKVICRELGEQAKQGHRPTFALQVGASEDCEETLDPA